MYPNAQTVGRVTGLGGRTGEKGSTEHGDDLGLRPEDQDRPFHSLFDPEGGCRCRTSGRGPEGVLSPP